MVAEPKGLDVAVRRRRHIRDSETAHAGTGANTSRTDPAAGSGAVEGVLAGDAGERARASTEGRNVGTGSFDVTAGVAVVVDAAELVGDAGATVGTATLFALVSTDTGEGER